MMAWENDQLNREQVSHAYEEIVRNLSSGSVVLVHGSFGSGKTFFVENWSQSLIDRDERVIVFDAWRNDYLESPLAGFIASLGEQASELSESDKIRDLRAAIINFARKATPLLLRNGIRVATRLLTMGAIDGDIDTIREAIAAEGINLGREATEELVSSFANVTSQKQLHEALSSAFHEIVQSLNKEGSSLPVIVMIDELDRCRPDFAFSLLEDIKHFLGVEGVCFMIFCDEDVLQAQASKIFGDKSSGEKYLSKFHRHRLRLPPMSVQRFIESVALEMGVGLRDYQASYLARVCEVLAVSARQIKNILEFVRVYSAINNDLSMSWPLVLVLGALREADPAAYNAALNSDAAGLPEKLKVVARSDATLNAVEIFLQLDSSTRAVDFDNADSSVDLRTRSRVLELWEQSGAAWGSAGEARQIILRRLEFVGQISG
jgi:hypothetical protein